MNKIQNTENDINIHEEEVMPTLEETLSKNEIVHIDNRNDKFEEIIAKRENEQRPQVNHVSINKVIIMQFKTVEFIKYCDS